MQCVGCGFLRRGRRLAAQLGTPKLRGSIKSRYLDRIGIGPKDIFELCQDGIQY